jgi:hypothetical protein
MRSIAILALALVALSGTAQAQPDKQNLRATIKLLLMAFTFGVGFSPTPGKAA